MPHINFPATRFPRGQGRVDEGVIVCKDVSIRSRIEITKTCTTAYATAGRNQKSLVFDIITASPAGIVTLRANNSCAGPENSKAEPPPLWL